MQVSFIGTGSMGSTLVESFVGTGALAPSQITVSNRTFDKAEQLADRHPGMKAVRGNVEAVIGSRLVFLCVKPLEFKGVIDEIRASMQPEQMIVSITSPVLLAHLEECLPCKVAKVIPSITNLVYSGASLCMYGSRVTPEDKRLLEKLLTRISNPIGIDERYTRIVSDLSSCGPAFMAFVLQKFVDAAVSETGIAREDAVRLAGNMLLGTGLLLTEGGMTPETLVKRVSVPGGITARALDVLQLELDGVFERLVRATHAKYEEDLEKVEQSFAVKR